MKLINFFKLIKKYKDYLNGIHIKIIFFPYSSQNVYKIPTDEKQNLFKERLKHLLIFISSLIGNQYSRVGASLLWWPSGKESAYNAGAIGDISSISGLGRSPGGGHSNPLQYSCLENPWTEEPDRPQSIKLQRIGHNQATQHAPRGIEGQIWETSNFVSTGSKSWWHQLADHTVHIMEVLCASGTSWRKQRKVPAT